MEARSSRRYTEAFSMILCVLCASMVKFFWIFGLAINAKSPLRGFCGPDGTRTRDLIRDRDVF